MDKKNMEKIDMLYELVAKRNRQLEERYKAIKESLFTPDMKKIMQTLYEHFKKEIKFKESSVTLRFVDTSSIDHPVFTLQYLENGCSPVMIKPWDLGYKEYTESMIRTLENHVKKAKEIDKRLTFIEDHAEEFVKRIGEYYAKYVENESDKLDELLREMDCEMTPTKHLKVTVEWI